MIDATFIDELASSSPVPGGGGASAYVGALATAAASMVGNLTVGKKTYVNVEGEVQSSLVRLDALRARLIELVEEDARVFEPLSATYRMPKGTPEEVTARNDAMQAALVGACEVPLEIMRKVAKTVDEIDFLAHYGSKLARSDAGVAAAFARAAVDGASLNVFINVASMQDATLADCFRNEAEALIEDVRMRCDDLFDYVKAAVS